MGKGKGRKTPPELDEFFDRDVIDESDYRDFWPKWWKATSQQREQIKEELSAKIRRNPAQYNLKLDEVLPARKGKHGKEIAERYARELNWRVVRRNASGAFSKRGNFWQAIPRGKSKRG